MSTIIMTLITLQHTHGRPHALRSIVEIFIVPLVISLSDVTPCCITVLFAFGAKIK